MVPTSSSHSAHLINNDTRSLDGIGVRQAGKKKQKINARGQGGHLLHAAVSTAKCISVVARHVFGATQHKHHAISPCLSVVVHTIIHLLVHMYREKREDGTWQRQASDVLCHTTYLCVITPPPSPEENTAHLQRHGALGTPVATEGSLYTRVDSNVPGSSLSGVQKPRTTTYLALGW